MIFVPFRRCRNNSSDLGWVRRRQDEGDAGSVSKVPHTKKDGRERGVPSTACELDVVPIPRK